MRLGGISKMKKVIILVMSLALIWTLGLELPTLDAVAQHGKRQKKQQMQMWYKRSTVSKDEGSSRCSIRNIHRNSQK